VKIGKGAICMRVSQHSLKVKHLHSVYGKKKHALAYIEIGGGGCNEK
jgi:hypothetical protein